MKYAAGEKVRWTSKISVGWRKSIKTVNFGIVVEGGIEKTKVRDSYTKRHKWINTENLKRINSGDL